MKMTFIIFNLTNTLNLIAAELVLGDLWIAFLQFKVSDVLAMVLKGKHGSADVKEYIAVAGNKNSRRREKERAAGACLTAFNFQITCKWKLFI